ncbi:LamG-like jellyroll fold domain-containing protein [Kribbella sp. NPDC051620]|uniref:LamG-like jellyroll fold domain-containing protein n=1 Tax=Kribbella sp. NPDC051620 TaxID=3364120 RepID=UPI00379F7E84
MLSVVVAGLVTVPVATAAKPVPAPKSAKNAAEAGRLAAQFKTDVEVADKTNEYARTVATPTGTLRTELSNTPVRARSSAGWVPVDRTLAVRADGMIAPKAATTDVAFSNGGGTSLAKFAENGGVFELKSLWKLPKPVLAGSKATYAGVLPGVDLVVEATDQGFSYNLVVQTRAAAANPALRSIQFPVTTSKLALRTTDTGRSSYTDPSGRDVLSVGEAVMWDSTGRATAKTKLSAAAAVGDGPADKAKRTMMPFTGSRAGLTITPDQSLLTDPATVYPVVIDPTMTGTSNRNGWTAAWELYPTQSFWKTEHSLGVGYEGFEQNKIVRSFFQFDVASFTSKKIIAASLRTYETHSASCTDRRVIVSRTAPISAATTWNNQPGGQADVATFDGAKGWSSACPAGYVEFDVTNSVQYTSSGNGRTATFRLRAATENDELGWKQFDSTGLLTIEFVANPLPANNLGAASDSDFADDCAPSSDPTYVAVVRPNVFATGRIGAGDTQSRVVVQLQIVSPSGSIWTMNSPEVAPNTQQKTTPASNLAENVLYRYHARTLLNYPGGQLASAWSGDCYFMIDLHIPPPPTITASYNGQVLTDCLGPGATPGVCPESVPFGARVTYTITSSTADVVALSYGFNGKLTRVNGKSVTVNLETPGQGYMTLGAVAHDAGSHPSEPRYHRINVGPGLPPSGSWNLDDDALSPTAADASGQNHPLSIVGPDYDDNGRIGGSRVFNGIADRMTSTAPVVDTSKSFTLSAWARLTDFSEGAVVGIFGSQGIAAQLYYSQNANRWLFMQFASDSTTAAQTRSDSVEPPMWGVWTHLIGVYDANAKTMTLYVNGRSQGSTSFTYAPWKATGPLEVGWYKVGANHGAAFTGSIDDVKVYPRMMSATEAKKVADPRSGPSGNDEPVAGLAADYPFESVVTGADQVARTSETVYAAKMIVSGFGPTTDQSAAIVQDPERGYVLSTSGASGEVVSLPRPVVDATGSFTVLVWVKLSDTSKPRVIVRQAGTTKDSWRLEYKPTIGDEAVWAFSRSTSDSAGGTVATATQQTTLSLADDWTALAATYDAYNGKISLKIADRETDGAEAGFTTPVRTGSTVIAGPPLNGTSLPYTGLIDNLRIYAGVVPQRLLCTEVKGAENCS